MSLGVNLPRHLQTIGVGKILVRSGDRQYDRIRLLNVLHHHIPDLTLDIAGLVADRHLCETGQINEGQSEDVGRVDAEVDGGRGDTGVFADLCLCLAADLIADLVEVEELLAGDVEELAPLVRVGFLVGTAAVVEVLVGAVNFVGGGAVD